MSAVEKVVSHELKKHEVDDFLRKICVAFDRSRGVFNVYKSEHGAFWILAEIPKILLAAAEADPVIETVEYAVHGVLVRRDETGNEVFVNGKPMPREEAGWLKYEPGKIVDLGSVATIELGGIVKLFKKNTLAEYCTLPTAQFEELAEYMARISKRTSWGDADYQYDEGPCE